MISCHRNSDHVGTPYKIVNSANAQVWYWDHHPFGETIGITTVAGFRHELRFPGHIYDSETGLFNNGFRDYWPYLGRYIESDPIGIAGGIGTYSYAGNNPVNAIDPFGLDPKSNEDDAEALPTIDIAGQQNVIQAGAANTIFGVVVGWIRNGAAALGRGAAKKAGDLTASEMKAIQGVVDEAGRPLNVVGSAARGTRRGVGSGLPIGKGPGTQSDIDYILPPSSQPYFVGLEGRLPSLDPATGIIPGSPNPYIGPSIRFEPGALPRFVPGQ